MDFMYVRVHMHIAHEHSELHLMSISPQQFLGMHHQESGVLFLRRFVEIVKKSFLIELCITKLYD